MELVTLASGMVKTAASEPVLGDSKGLKPKHRFELRKVLMWGLVGGVILIVGFVGTYMLTTPSVAEEGIQKHLAAVKADREQLVQAIEGVRKFVREKCPAKSKEFEEVAAIILRDYDNQIAALERKDVVASAQIAGRYRAVLDEFVGGLPVKGPSVAYLRDLLRPKAQGLWDGDDDQEMFALLEDHKE